MWLPTEIDLCITPVLSSATHMNSKFAVAVTNRGSDRETVTETLFKETLFVQITLTAGIQWNEEMNLELR